MVPSGKSCVSLRQKKHRMKFSQVCHSGPGVPQDRVERTWVERETDKDEGGTSRHWDGDKAIVILAV